MRGIGQADTPFCFFYKGVVKLARILWTHEEVKVKGDSSTMRESIRSIGIALCAITVVGWALLMLSSAQAVSPPTPIASSAATPQAPPLSCLPRFSRPELQVEVALEGNPGWLIVEDYNHDGLDDVFVVRRKSPGFVDVRPVVLLNDGSGGLVESTSSVFLGPVPELPLFGYVVVDDFNGDTHPDVFWASAGVDLSPWPGAQNRLFLSAPGGKLVDATSNIPQQLDFPHSADAADIDGDGDLDLYVGNIGGGIGPQIWINDGSGAFVIGEGRLPAIIEDLTRDDYTACRFADVNDDGAPDLILGESGGVINYPSEVLLNDGQGRFSIVPDAMPPKPWDPTDVALDIRAMELNGDQHLDLLMLHALDDYEGGWHIQILIGNGAGAFQDETDARLPQVPNDDPWIELMNLVDLDYDGDLDIAPLGRTANKVPPFFLNDGQGHFVPFEPPLDFGPFDFMDIDGNGRRDVLFSTAAREVLPEQYFIMRDVGCPVAFLPLVIRGEATTPEPEITGVVSIYAESWDLGGWGWPPYERVSVDVYAPAGRLMDTFFADADSQGNLRGLTRRGVPSEYDWITLIASSGGRTTFQVKFPRATADPEANTIVGVAEPNVELEAGVEHPEGTWHGLPTRAAEDGAFSFDFSPLVDWEYGDDLFVGQYVSENARINIGRDSPNMIVLEPSQ